MNKVTIAQLERSALRPSYELARAQFMGWTFSKPTIDQSPPGARLSVAFTCVCGQRETFQYVATSLEGLRHVDVARHLVGSGSFSREHLLKDGYTEEQVREIERKGEEFDRVTRQHWELEIHRAGGFDQFRMQNAMRGRDVV